MRHRWLVPAAIIAALFTLQSLRHVGNGPWGVDGSYYMQVARHVAAGEGLLTSVDISDQGLRTLPARTNIYPLWPLILGFAARLMPLNVAATLVPRLFFVIDLALLYALVSRVAPRSYAYAAILLFGLNASFFSSTAYPYTEGLALCCLFGSLVLFDTARARNDLLYYGLCGVAAGAAFLTRSQMLLLGVALFIVLITTKTHIRNIAVFSAACAVTVLPWVVYLTTFVRPFTPRALIAMYSETPGLPQYDQHVTVHGALGYVVDRLHGVIVAFNPFSDLSFVELFGFAALFVPIGAIYALWKRQWIGGATAAAIAWSGALICATLLDAHNRFFLEWLFGYRHGLPFMLLIVAAAAQMVGRYSHVVAAVLVAISLVTAVPRVFAFATEQPADWPSPAETQLSTWLQRNDANAIVLTTNAQALSVVSNANFRWAACDQTSAEIGRVLQLVRTDYVLVYEQEQRCSFAQGLQATGALSFGSPPNRIFLLKVRR